MAAALVSRFGDHGTRPGVVVLDTSSGDQLHRFTGTHHAPFISVAEYWPTYRRHDPGYVLVDVRTRTARQNVRIPDSLWVPLADSDATGWRSLMRFRDRTVVLYCSCPWAEAADESEILLSHGFPESHLRVLHEGIQGWMEAGHPVVSGGDPCEARRWPQACAS